MMQITTRTITMLTILAAVAIALATAAYLHLPAGDVTTSLFETLVTGASLIAGGLVTAFSIYSEQRRTVQANERRKLWALRRLIAEIVNGMAAAERVIEKPLRQRLTLLPDDVWVTSRNMLAEHLTCDPTHYALTDYYKTLRVLQISEEKRLGYVLSGGDEPVAAEIVTELATTVITIGQRAVDLLLAYEPTLEIYAAMAATEDDTYHESAHHEAIKQVADGAA